MKDMIWWLAGLGAVGVLMVGVALFCVVYHVIKHDDEVN